MRFIPQDSFKALDKTDPANNDSLIVHCRPRSTNESIVVFVHGLGGRRYGTWGNIPGFLFNDLPDLDVGLYDYSSGIRRVHRRSSVSLGRHAKEFADSLRDSGFRNVVLVGHSMGGILCKAVVKELVDSQARTPLGDVALGMISGIFLLATPQAGSRRVPGLLAHLTSDARVLRTHSSFVSDIDERFRDRINSDINGNIPEGGRICIPTYAVIATGDVWVDPLSASLNLSRDQVKNVRGTHTSIIAVESPQAGLYPWLVSRIKSCINRPPIQRVGVVEMLRPNIERGFEPLILTKREGVEKFSITLDLLFGPQPDPEVQDEQS